jgi:GNAT superfamily N-acetyltransferase
VVFAVARNQRRRGIGSVILRHLAWVAMAKGIRVFEATTTDRAALALVRTWFQPRVRVDHEAVHLGVFDPGRRTAADEASGRGTGRGLM